MRYAIIGFGSIGQALARAFARNGIEVAVATTRAPETFASTAAAIGPAVVAKTLADALGQTSSSWRCDSKLIAKLRRRCPTGLERPSST